MSIINKGKSLLKGSAFQTAELILQLAVSFIMTPFIIHSLGDRLYGFWVLVGTLLGYYGLLELGLGTAVSRYVARAIGKKDSAEINAIVNTSLAIYFYIGLTVIGVTAVVSLLNPPFLKTAEEVRLFRIVMPMLGLSLGLGYMLRVFRGVLVSYLRYDLSSSAAIVKILIANVIVFLVLKAGGGIVALTVITFCTNLLEYGLLFLWARRVFPEMRIGRQHVLKERLGLLFGYSAKSLIAQLADLVRYRADYLVIAWVLDMKLVTYYAVGLRLIDYFYQFVRNSVGLAKPIYSQYEGEGRLELLRERFCDITRLSTIAAVFIGMSIAFYGKPFIQRWMGPAFSSSYVVALILCIPWTLELMQSPTSGLLYGLSKHHYFSIANSVEAALNLALSLILAQHLGIYGVALGTAIPMVIFRLIFQPLFTCRAIGLKPFDYYFKTLGAPLVLTALPLGLYFFLARGFLRPDYSRLGLCAGLQAVLFSAWAYRFILGNKERTIIMRAIGLRRE